MILALLIPHGLVVLLLPFNPIEMQLGSSTGVGIQRLPVEEDKRGLVGEVDDVGAEVEDLQEPGDGVHGLEESSEISVLFDARKAFSSLVLGVLLDDGGDVRL